MKANSHKNDQLFRKSVNNDNPAIEPHPALAERLNYYYTLKQPTRKVHANSFAGMITWLFSLKSITLKTSLASFCLAYFLFVGNIKNNSNVQGLSDTCQIHQTLADSSYMAKDTCK